MDAKISKDYSAVDVNFYALINIHNNLFLAGKALHSEFTHLSVMRELLVFMYTSSEDIRKEYWPKIILGLSVQLTNKAAEKIWSVLFPEQNVDTNMQDNDEPIELSSDDAMIQGFLQFED